MCRPKVFLMRPVVSSSTYLALWQAGFVQADVLRSCATTIAFRLPILATAMTRQDASARQEASEMVYEKVAATIEGAGAGMIAWQHLWIDMVFGRLTTDKLVTAAMDVADAAAAPARKAVSANAKRLTRRALAARSRS